MTKKYKEVRKGLVEYLNELIEEEDYDNAQDILDLLRRLKQIKKKKEAE